MQCSHACLAMLFIVIIEALAQPQVQWQRTYGSAEDEIGYALLPTGNGWLVAGSTTLSHGGMDGFALWISSTGDSLFSRTYGGTNDDVFFAVASSAEAGIYVFAGTYAIGPWMGRGIWLVATSFEGDLLWERTYGTEHGGEAFSIINADEGNFVVGGDIFSSDTANGHAFMMLINSEGDSLDGAWYGGTDARPWQVILPQPNGYLLAGSLVGAGFGSDYWVISTTLEFDSLWSAHYGATDEALNGAVRHANGHLVLAGTSFEQGDWRAFLIGTDENGDSLWSRTVGQDMIEYVNGAAPAPEMGCYVVGWECCSWGFGSNALVLRADSVGNVLWYLPVDAGGINENAFAVRPTPEGLIIGGYWQATSSGDPAQIFVAALTDPTSTSPEVSASVEAFALDPVFPNPFNSATEIRFALRVNAHVELSIFNTLGQKVATLIDEPRAAGTYHVTWNGSNAASGLYLCQLKAGNSIQTRKMMLLK